MKMQKYLRKGIRKKFLGCIFALVLLISSLFTLTPGITGTQNAYAEPEETTTSTTSCKDSLGSLGWLVCPATGKISEAVDWLYDKIEDVLVINPVEAKDGSPVYEIWKYFQGVTNIVFIIFLLVIVYSQITGMGITNYGVKKALPKLIVAAILVNVSFYICSLAVDVSNIFGEGLRGLFNTIATSTGIVADGETLSTGVKMAQMHASMADGLALTVAGGVIAFETGAIWMLIPLAFGALISVVVGLITIAMRQAVVTLLIMIAPLAMVACILPNTEQWFKKWRQLMFQMLIFYPAFSLLFGASSIAGWALIVSATNGFTVMIGVAVQIFPLFFSWNLMKMSGTFLSTINAKLTGLASRPMAGIRAEAAMQQEHSRQKHLASPNAYSPTMRLQQYMSNRRISIGEETKEYAETVQKRGLAYNAMRNYKRDGETPSRDGEESYEMQARNMEYDKQVLRHKNNMNKGLGQLSSMKRKGADRAQKARLDALDAANVKASDTLKMEQARGEMIDYRNAVGYHERMEAAMNSHMDDLHYGEIKDGKQIYKRHFEPGSLEATQAAARYADLSNIMEGDVVVGSHFATADAAYQYDSQNRVFSAKMEKYMSLVPPTKDLVYRLEELTKSYTAAQNIDGIIPGLKVLAQRGDTDIIREQIKNILDYSQTKEKLDSDTLQKLEENNFADIGVHLGSHASQALASYLMFDVGDKDPTLKRFGKYINLETAHAYNKNIRQNTRLTFEEYLRGFYEEYDAATQEMVERTPNRGMIPLLEGTSLDGVERTAYRNLDEMLMDAYRKADGTVDVRSYLARREEVETAIGPQFISASLKYLSGSEQLKSAVEFLTGRNRGKVRWEQGGELAPTEEEAKYAESYFRRKTLQYFRDQTPAQIFGLRSDYKDPVMEHLLSALFEEHPEKQEEYNNEVARIQTMYGDEDIDEANKKRQSDIKSLKMKLAGDEIRSVLDKSGKLEQIYRTRRSGAGNNAKDWLRDWLLLNDEGQIYRYLEKKERERGDNPDISLGDGGLPGEEGDKARARNAGIVDSLYHKYEHKDEKAFRKAVREKLVEFAGEGVLTHMYDDYIRSKKGQIDNYDLKENIIMWLVDPENYK